MKHKPMQPNMNSHLTENEKLIRACQQLRSVITDAQCKFAQAIYVLNRKYPGELSEDQVRVIQREINDATLNIVVYKDLLRRCYEAIGIPNPVD
jgi:hypothetical protein